MLTKHVVEPRRKRTSRRALTEEGLALKDLRQTKKLSMRQLGQMVNKSDSYISHIENGRLDFPTGQALDTLLTIFELKPKSFYERARKCRVRLTQEQFIVDWLRNSEDTDVSAIYDLISCVPN